MMSWGHARQSTLAFSPPGGHFRSNLINVTDDKTA